MSVLPALRPADRDLLDRARRAVLATTRADGRSRLVPIAFAVVVSDGRLTLYSPLDEKPKSVNDPRHLGRVRDVLDRPAVTVLVDHWSEDWSELAWLRLEGQAAVLEPAADAAEHGQAVALLRARYPQYADQQLDVRPLIRIDVHTVTGWSAR